MKKTVLFAVACLCLFSAACGKKEKGTLTVQNTSAHPVSFSVGQNYRIDNYTVAAAQLKSVHWEYYNLFWIESPKNIVTYTQSGSTVTIADNPPSYTVLIKNQTGATLTVKDDGLYVLAGNTPPPLHYEQNLSVEAGNKTYLFYGYLTERNFKHLPQSMYKISFKIETVKQPDGKDMERQIVKITN